MPATPEPQDHRTTRRRHPASRARVAAALLSMGGFLAAVFGMAAATGTLGTTSSGSTVSGTTSSSSTAATAPSTGAPPAGATPAAASTGTKIVTATHAS